MKKLINKIAKDKLLHLIGGTYIFLLSNIFFEKWIAMFIVLTISILIEAVWDGLMKKGTPEVLDVVWTVIGGVIALTLTM